MKGASDQAITAGWYAAVLPGQKRIKPLAEYLKPAPSPERQRDLNALKVKQMLDRMIAKQETENGPR